MSTDHKMGQSLSRPTEFTRQATATLTAAALAARNSQLATRKRSLTTTTQRNAAWTGGGQKHHLIALGLHTQKSRRDAPIVNNDTTLTMTETSPLEALEALHRELVAICDHRFESLQILEQELNTHAEAFQRLLDKPPRSDKSRSVVKTGMLGLQVNGHLADLRRTLDTLMLTISASQASSLLMTRNTPLMPPSRRMPSSWPTKSISTR